MSAAGQQREAAQAPRKASQRAPGVEGEHEAAGRRSPHVAATPCARHKKTAQGPGQRVVVACSSASARAFAADLHVRHADGAVRQRVHVAARQQESASAHKRYARTASICASHARSHERLRGRQCRGSEQRRADALRLRSAQCCCVSAMRVCTHERRPSACSQAARRSASLLACRCAKYCATSKAAGASASPAASASGSAHASGAADSAERSCAVRSGVRPCTCSTKGGGAMAAVAPHAPRARR